MPLRPTSLPMKASKSTVAPNQKVALIGWLKSGHTSVPGAPVALEKRIAGAATFTAVSTKTTGNDGKVTLVVTPGARRGQKVQYQLVFAGNSSYRSSHSQVIALTVG
jgi:5-hydroxyisourate hydrolase-like protein (transthyretin family)